MFSVHVLPNSSFTVGDNALHIVMKEDAVMLEETVVIGYGTQKKVNLTGAVASVSSKDLENRVAHSVTDMLQGSVAGLNITTSSGVPGQEAAINVRLVHGIEYRARNLPVLRRKRQSALRHEQQQ